MINLLPPPYWYGFQNTFRVVLRIIGGVCTYVSMEYTYRSSLDEMPTTICLAEYNLTIKRGKQETVIPYAIINEVVLKKNGGKRFRTQLLPDGGKRIEITNTYHTTAKNVEDRSRAYSTFVRVLHFHLKDKSKARFSATMVALKLFRFPKTYAPTDIPLEFLP